MHLDIVTPRGRLLSEEVEEVTAPGILGEFGVLPGHIPFLTALKPGVLRYRSAASSAILAVGPGFVEVSAGDRIVVLAELGAKADDIDVAAARKERDQAQKALDHWDPKSEGDDAGKRADLEAQRAWADAQVLAAEASGASSAH
jgi:F-type H+-transporting ATPase subunit epsilon